MVGIIWAVSLIGGIGLFVGVFLGIASQKLKVEVDEREEKILKELPGNNCGGCGYPGCSGLATAIVKGEAAVNACPVGGAAVGTAISSIMGVEASEEEPLVAVVKCAGTCDQTERLYEYTGTMDCRMAQVAPGAGGKSCAHGCLGLGSCVKACSFGAISIQNGVAVVDKEKCKGCGKCVGICPKNILELVPKSTQYVVQCTSKDKGPSTMKACKTGCIGCGLCVKNCPQEAITLTENHAHIDQEKCVKCGICVAKCPKKIIKEMK